MLRRRHSMMMLGMLGGCALLLLGLRIFILVRWSGVALAHASNQQVAARLGSHDLVEMQRAGILVRELNCDVVHRMPARL